MAVTTVLRARVARSARRLWKLWTGAPVGGSAGGLLGDGLGRALRLGDGAVAEGLGGLPVVVVVEHGGQPGAHAPLQPLDAPLLPGSSAEAALHVRRYRDAASGRRSVAAPIAVNGERREKRRFSNGEDFLVALQRRLA